MRRPFVMAGLVALLAVAGGAESFAPAAAAPSRATPKGDVRVVTMNILHGVTCPGETNDCQGDDRIALLGLLLKAAKCPPVVALEEISPRMYDRVTAAPWVKECKYEIVWHNMPLIDRELVLTTLPVKSQKLTSLAGGFRSAYRLELRSKLGPVVLVVSHQDGDPEPGQDPRPCTPADCPPPCPATVTIPACQTVQAEALSDQGGPRTAIRILTGDFNVTATSDRYRSLVAGGWIDSHLAAGNRECDPSSSKECSSGRQDMVVDDLKNPASRETERIDFLFVKTPRGCKARFDPHRDRDRDGLGTGLFGEKPVTGAPGGIVFASDHTGVAADLSCRNA